MSEHGRTTPEGGARYSSVATILHWLIAAAIILQSVLDWGMRGHPSPATLALFQLHVSTGITILILSLARLGWRLANPPFAAASVTLASRIPRSPS